MFIKHWICKTFCGHLHDEIDALRYALGKKIARNIAKPPKRKRKISRDEAYKLFKSFLPCGGAILVLGSDYYWLVSKADIERFLKADLTDAFPYTDNYKCRNFSFRLLGDIQIPGWTDIALFGIWAGGHAFNCFIDEDKRIWYIEPQTDEIFAPNSDKGKRLKPIGAIIG